MGIDKFLTYPLAMLGSLALISPSSDLGRSREGTENTASAPSLTPIRGRSSAESAELRALREAEGTLFPELAASDRDLVDATLPTPACDSPDYELSKSTSSIDVSAAADWLRGLERPAIAIPRDPKVARYIRYFGGHAKGREIFSQWLRRSGSYRTIVESALVKRNLPLDILAVMFVESGCLPKATSGVGAAGLWQFMPQTARAYGLTVRADYDERRDVWRSTDAAVTHLADLYSRFESWHLAFAAYNMGYQQLLDRLAETHTEDFFSLSNVPEALPTETMLYVPKILAVAVILRNLAYFGFDGQEVRPALSASRIEVPAGTSLALVARAAGTSQRKLAELNPHIAGEIVPKVDGSPYVYLPNSGATRARVMLPRLLEEKLQKPIELQVTGDFDWGRDEFDSNWKSRLEKTAPQDTDSKSAEGKSADSKSAEGKSADSKSAANHAKGSKSPSRTSGKGSEGPSVLEAFDENRSPWGFTQAPAVPAQSRQQSVIFHRVRRGDTLSYIALQYGVPIGELAATNNLTTKSKVLLGSKLRIVVPEDRLAKNR